VNDSGASARHQESRSWFTGSQDLQNPSPWLAENATGSYPDVPGFCLCRCTAGVIVSAAQEVRPSRRAPRAPRSGSVPYAGPSLGLIRNELAHRQPPCGFTVRCFQLSPPRGLPRPVFSPHHPVSPAEARGRPRITGASAGRSRATPTRRHPHVLVRGGRPGPGGVELPCCPPWPHHCRREDLLPNERVPAPAHAISCAGWTPPLPIASPSATSSRPGPAPGPPATWTLSAAARRRYMMATWFQGPKEDFSWSSREGAPRRGTSSFTGGAGHYFNGTRPSRRPDDDPAAGRGRSAVAVRA